MFQSLDHVLEVSGFDGVVGLRHQKQISCTHYFLTETHSHTIFSLKRISHKHNFLIDANTCNFNVVL